MTESRREDLVVPVDALRWQCDPAWVSSFESTAAIEPIPGVVGQEDAIESLRFGVTP